MDIMKMDRRSVCTGITALVGTPAAAAELVRGKSRPIEPSLSSLHRFMKIYASLTSDTIWYWYSGTLELAPSDGPVTPMLCIETLIRRDVAVNKDGTFTVITSEANYFRDLHAHAPINEIVNPLTGRTVQPLHFSEGRRPAIWSEESLAPRHTAELDTSIDYREAGPYTWLYRTLRADFPHPLKMADWPLEASGPRNRTGSYSTHCVLTSDLVNPAIATAPCSFTYEAVFGWLPWLLMGQRPGNLLWRATGLKLPTIGSLPSTFRDGFEGMFPEIFTTGDFGPRGANLWERFRATHSPARP